MRPRPSTCRYAMPRMTSPVENEAHDMATGEKITPAPKPSQRTRKKPSAEVAKDDALTGVVTVDPEQLRENAKKLQELLDSPDGTPGKDVALRVKGEQERAKAAAPIITAAVKDVKQWQQLHGKAEKVTKSLATHLVQLRTVYTDAEGQPDMRGRSQEYREAAASIYTKAGIESDSVAHTLQASVRYHTSDIVRELLRNDERFANGDEDQYLALCGYYKLNPKGVLESRKAARQSGASLPALTLPTGDVAAMWEGGITYAQKALEVPGDAIPADLPDEARETLRERLTAVRERAEMLLAELGDGEEEEEDE